MYQGKKRPRATVIIRHVFFAAPDGKLNRELATIKKPKNGNQTELF